jgi:hypothetical protein
MSTERAQRRTALYHYIRQKNDTEKQRLLDELYSKQNADGDDGYAMYILEHEFGLTSAHGPKDGRVYESNETKKKRALFSQLYSALHWIMVHKECPKV